MGCAPLHAYRGNKHIRHLPGRQAEQTYPLCGVFSGAAFETACPFLFSPAVNRVPVDELARPRIVVAVRQTQQPRLRVRVVPILAPEA